MGLLENGELSAVKFLVYLYCTPQPHHTTPLGIGIALPLRRKSLGRKKDLYVRTTSRLVVLNRFIKKNTKCTTFRRFLIDGDAIPQYPQIFQDLCLLYTDDS